MGPKHIIKIHTSTYRNKVMRAYLYSICIYYFNLNPVYSIFCITHAKRNSCFEWRNFPQCAAMAKTPKHNKVLTFAAKTQKHNKALTTKGNQSYE